MPQPRKPAAWHVLTGNYRPSRHGPRPSGSAPPPLSAEAAPDRLDPDARRAWSDIVAAGGGRLVENDAILVELAAALIAKQRRGEAKAADLSVLARLLGMLRLDPAHRDPLPPAERPENPFDEF